MPNVKVLLNENVEKLGKVGDLVDVKPGYARNYLLPGKLATLPSIGEIRRLKKKRELIEKEYQEQKASATALKEKLEQSGSVEFKLKAGDSGKTFGSINAKNVSEKLKELFNLEVDRKQIHMKKALTALGEYTVHLKLHPEVTADITVEIKKEEEEK